MQARLKIGEVLLTASIAGVFAHLFLAIMPGDVPLGQGIGKGEATNASQF